MLIGKDKRIIHYLINEELMKIISINFLLNFCDLISNISNPLAMIGKDLNIP